MKLQYFFLGTALIPLAVTTAAEAFDESPPLRVQPEQFVTDQPFLETVVADLLDAPELIKSELDASEARTIGFSLTGLARSAEGGIVTVEIEPTPEEMAAYEPGDERASDYLAAAYVDSDGTYEIAIPAARAVNVGRRQLRITTLDRSGALIGVTLTDPEPTHAPSEGVSLPTATERKGEDDLPTIAAHGGTLSVDVAPLNAGTSTTLFNSAPEAAARAAFQPADPCGSTSCCRWYFQYHAYPRITVATAGTNTRYATVSAGYTTGAKSQLGWTVHVGGQGWSVGGGTTTTTNRSVAIEWPPSNRYGLDSFKVVGQYAESIHWCWLNNGPGQPKTLRYDRTERRPSGITAGDQRYQWMGANQFFPRNCVSKGKSTTTISYSKAVTYQGGVELSYVRASAQTGYTTATWLRWTFDRAGKWLCGESNRPGLDNAGRMMADWKNR